MVAKFRLELCINVAELGAENYSVVAENGTVYDTIVAENEAEYYTMVDNAC